MGPPSGALARLLLLLLLALGRAEQLQQHVCCLMRGPSADGLHAQLPEALNHSAMREVACAAVEGVHHVRKGGSACSYCMCLYDDGADFGRSPDCCSLKSFGQPGVDARTGHPMCQRYRKTYNLATGVTRACELRYDLYHFAATSAGSRMRLARWTIALLLPLAGVVKALSPSALLG
mmetsp:Transcript_100015/g.291731  ORF Transcript_100015/g.291731 Transcript_100015/m.291731 type:complete len:177 (+) Transcript_100015:129-659(+)